MIAQQLVNGIVTELGLRAVRARIHSGVRHLQDPESCACRRVQRPAPSSVISPCSTACRWLALVLAMVGAGLVSHLVEVTAFATIRGSGQIEFGALISSIGANLCA